MPDLEYGLQLKKEGHLQAAQEIFKKLISENSDVHNARHHLGNTLVANGNLQAGINELKTAFKENPHDGLVAYNLGLALFLAQQFREALAAFNVAVTLLPKLIDTLINRGSCYHALGRLEEALQDFDKAIKLKPDEADSHWNRALTLLTMGRYHEGFKEYEWRWKRDLRTRTYPHKFEQKRWHGEPFQNRRLLVYSEQGLGDTIQFARFLPRVKALGGTLIFEVRPELSRLLNKPDGVDEIGIYTPKTPRKNDFDLQIPLMSLPEALGIEITSLPKPTIIKVEPNKKAYWQKQLDPEKINIGLAWAGRATHVNDMHRSLHLAAFNELADLDGTHFYSLQTGKPSRQVESFIAPEKFSDYSSDFHDFTDTAALINELDLVISVDTAVAHLAASLNRPTWILLSFVPDWRWQRESKNSPWYPSITIFRQPRPGDWKTILNEIKSSIEIHFTPQNQTNHDSENISPLHEKF